MNNHYKIRHYHLSPSLLVNISNCLYLTQKIKSNETLFWLAENITFVYTKSYLRWSDLKDCKHMLGCEKSRKILFCDILLFSKCIDVYFYCTTIGEYCFKQNILLHEHASTIYILHGTIVINFHAIIFLVYSRKLLLQRSNVLMMSWCEVKLNCMLQRRVLHIYFAWHSRRNIGLHYNIIYYPILNVNIGKSVHVIKAGSRCQLLSIRGNINIWIHIQISDK